MNPIRSFGEGLCFMLEVVAVGLIISICLSLHEANRQLARAGEALKEARLMAQEVNRLLVDILNQGPTYPPADTLYLDEEPKDIVITYIDGQNALVVMRTDGQKDTLYFGGNRVPTVMMGEHVDTTSIGNISTLFHHSRDVWEFRASESKERPTENLIEEEETP